MWFNTRLLCLCILDVCALTCNLACKDRCWTGCYIISPSNSIGSLFNPKVQHPVHVWVGVYLRGISILHVILGNKIVLEVLEVSSNW
jgi:hypothetical protein